MIEMPDAIAWRRWAPGMRPGGLPPPAVAAMVDAIAKTGAVPRLNTLALHGNPMGEAAKAAVKAAGDARGVRCVTWAPRA